MHDRGLRPVLHPHHRRRDSTPRSWSRAGGAGREPRHIYKYAVLLTYDDEAGPETSAAYSGVFDCFTNAVFSNLQADDAGSVSFLLQVYAFNQASYPAVLDDLTVADDAGAVEDLAAAATWTTTCTASQIWASLRSRSAYPLRPVGASLDAGPGEADAGPGDADAGSVDADAAGPGEPDAGALDGGFWFLRSRRPAAARWRQRGRDTIVMQERTGRRPSRCRSRARGARCGSS